jgi:hypothetical protein
MNKWTYIKLLLIMRWNMLFKKRQEGSVFIYEADQVKKKRNRPGL